MEICGPSDRLAENLARPKGPHKFDPVRAKRTFLPRLGWLCLTAVAGMALVPEAAAHTPGPEVASPLLEEKPADGRPMVVLDRLVFPQDVVGADGFEKHLKRALKREAYRVDWGAGRENRIEYRFTVTELVYKLSDGALRIECSAVGRLPGGQTAKSELTFGGSLSERNALTKQVLEIVARGVITRLAELERKRRGLR